MWISKPESLIRLKDPALDEIVELGEGESAQVTKEVGELLVENYDDISETNTD